MSDELDKVRQTLGLVVQQRDDARTDADRERGKVGDLVREVARKEALRAELAAEVDRLTEAVKTGAYWLALDGTIRTDDPGPDVRLIDRDDDVWRYLGDGMWVHRRGDGFPWGQLVEMWGPLREVAP